MLKIEQRVRVFDMRFSLRLPVVTRVALKFRVKISIVAKIVVIKFLVHQDRRVRPDVRNTEEFTPAWMATDDIRFKSLSFQFLTNSSAGFAANTLCFDVSDPGLNSSGAGLFGRVLTMCVMLATFERAFVH